MRPAYRAEDMERFITLHIDRRRKEQWAKNLPPQTIREIAERDVYREIAENLSLLSFDAFCEQRQKKALASEA